MKKQTERLLAFVFGVVFVVVLLVLALAVSTPTPFQYTVFRIVLALAAGGVAAMVPGFLSVTLSKSVRAGGALAVFVVVYFFSPVGLTGATVKTEQEVELEKPVVRRGGTSAPRVAVTAPLEAVERGVPREPPVPLLVVSDPAGLTAEVLMRRYEVLRISGARVRVPDGSTIVANEIDGEGGAALLGSDFSIVARRFANVTVDVSASREPDAKAGAAFLYVKVIENARLLATGANGAPGRNGDRGRDGSNGAGGRDGDCGGFGAYRGAEAGRPGEDGGDGQDGLQGQDGTAGGLVLVTAVINPVGTLIDVAGGQGGVGGQGGAGGSAGRGGTGGRGCTGLGGTQPNQADGASGRPGKAGHAGANGKPGPAGEYRLRSVKSFDDIVAQLDAHDNGALHELLRTPR